MIKLFFVCTLALCAMLIPTRIVQAATVELPQPEREGTLTVERTIEDRRSVRSYVPGSLALEEVGQLLWSAQGITEERRGFRAAPSAGALYPLTLYLVAGEVEGLEAGVWRYLPAQHAIERVVAGDVRENLSNAALRQDSLASAQVTLAIAADYDITAMRYGPRAERYVHIEVGHVGQNIYLQAESLGLGTVAIGAFDDNAVAGVLGIPENESPLYLMPVGLKAGSGE